MNRILAILTVTAILTAIPSPAAPGKGDTLSISVTNSYGDVFTNLIVVDIATNGLVLEHKTGLLKVTYEQLPPDVRKKYQPLSAEVAKAELKRAEANTDYAVRKIHLQADTIKTRELKDRRQANTLVYKSIDVPYQGWKIVVPDAGFEEADGGQSSEDIFVYQATGKDGFNLSIGVNNPPGEGTEDEDVFNYCWPQVGQNPYIDSKSIEAVRTKDFIRVSYMTGSIRHSDFYFAFRGKWAVVQISKSSYSDADAGLFDDFDRHLSYN